MTNLMKIDLPYFDLICEQLASLEAGSGTSLARTQAEARRIEKVLGKHVHYGYWRDPGNSRAADLDEYIVATEEMSLLHFEVAKLKSGQAVLDVGCGFGGSIDSINERYRKVAR